LQLDVRGLDHVAPPAAFRKNLYDHDVVPEAKAAAMELT
jgi:hypothetical protein